MRIAYWDIEADGLLDTVSTCHCISVSMNLENESAPRLFLNESVEEALCLLDSCDVIVGHNIIGYDVPALHKLYGWTPKATLRDTLILAQLAYPNLRRQESDKPRPDIRPGSNKLEDWGRRLGVLKGQYEGGWESYNEEMGEYCKQDAVVTKALYEHAMSKDLTPESIQLEHEFGVIMRRQEEYGWCFDVDGALKLYNTLLSRKAEVEESLRLSFKGFWKSKGEFTPKVNNKRIGYRKGCVCTKLKWTEFNPSSRDHIALVLEKRGWKPKAFTPAGKPKIDESVIAKMKFPEAPALQEYLMLQKRIGQLAEGKEAWLKNVKEGRIHGRVHTLGTVTGRCSHSNPNVANVPACRAPWGQECRSLFRASEGRCLVGADASGLELRCLAHYMDDPDYTEVILNGDIHSLNQERAGLSTRDQAKTFIYAFLYGAGDGKIGSIVSKGRGKGKELRDRFLKELPSLGSLVVNVKRAAKRGYLKGLDGRRLPVRSEHSALNTLLQSAGALVMKKACVLAYESLSYGYIHGHEYAFVGNIHDEMQLECDPVIAEVVGKTLVESIRKAGEHFNFRCPLAGEYKKGETWAETH